VLTHAPGHTPDLITAYVKEDKILFASDTIMPVPYIVDGDAAGMSTSLTSLKSLALENVVQGHGEIVLRGEISEAINNSLNYLEKMQGAVATALSLDQSRDDMLREYDIESCGRPRIALNGLVQQLHTANLITTYDRMSTERTSRESASARSQPASKARSVSKPAAAKKATVARKPAAARKPATARKPTAAKKSASARKPARAHSRSASVRPRRK
jgi:hypothetical protein